MMLHRAEDIAAEIRARLQAITTTNSAETDIGTSVFQGRRHIDDSMIPCVTIIEAEDTPDQTHVRDEYRLAQRYVLFAYLTCQPANPNVAAHAALRDMKRALFLTAGKADTRWGGKVLDVAYAGRDIGPRSDGSAFVVAAIEIAVTYVERLSAP